MLHTFGVETIALGLNAGLSGEMLATLLDDLNVPYDFVQADGYTRVAALITEVDKRRQSTIITHTLTAQPSHLDELVARAAAENTALLGTGLRQAACHQACRLTPMRVCYRWRKKIT